MSLPYGGIEDDRSYNLVFENEEQIDSWFKGEYTRPDKLRPKDLIVGQELLTIHPYQYNYWVSEIPVNHRNGLVKQDIPESELARTFKGELSPDPIKYSFWLDTSNHLESDPYKPFTLPGNEGVSKSSFSIFPTELVIPESEDPFGIPKEVIGLPETETQFTIEEPTIEIPKGDKFEIIIDEFGFPIIKEENNNGK